MNKLKQYLPILIIATGAVLFFILGGQEYLTLTMLKSNYVALQQFTHDHYFISVILYIASYTLVVAFSVPGATIMTLIGGFLFGPFLGGLWVVLSATTGATLTFLAVNTAFGEMLKNRAGDKLKRVTQGFTEHAFNYLIFLRLVPIFPFFMINIAAGVVGVRLRTFVITTFFGIMPGSFVYAWVGGGLGYTLSQGKNINMGIIFQPQVLFPMIALALLAIMPVLIKKIRANKNLEAPNE
jgi:uncharacterized membrane protein YdjX (TVP38/TMEM64 family)